VKFSRDLNDPMDKLEVECKRRSIKSVLMKLDREISGSDFNFSLQHLTVTDFFDISGDFCRGEARLPINRSEAQGDFVLINSVFSKIQEYDLLRLTLFKDNIRYNSWDFSWPDNSGLNV
jgi:hypothetical protein